MLKTAATFLYGSGALYGFVPSEAINSVILGVYPFIAFTWQIKTFGSLLRVLEALINPSPAPSSVFTAGIRFSHRSTKRGPAPVGCCCPGGGVAPCRADARPIASPWLPWGDSCGWSCRLFWGVLVSSAGALRCYTPAGTTGAGGGAGGHSSILVLWWLWLSSSCQQK